MRILVGSSFRAVAALFLVPFLVTALPAPAQTVAGTLQGTVMDPGGGPLPGASVVVRAIDTGFERRLVTNVVTTMVPVAAPAAS